MKRVVLNVCLAIMLVIGCSCNRSKNPKPLNVVLITADDLNCNSIGAYGCELEDITPNIDMFASQGLQFSKSHVAAAVCQVSRGALATGKYPHNSGIVGFFHTEDTIPTIVRTLKQNGYLCGLFGKINHSSPKNDTPWDVKIDKVDLGMGRNQDLFYENTVKFIKNAKKENKPFYLMANSHDPHRPFSGSEEELRFYPDLVLKAPSRSYLPNEVEVPGFVPDIPKVRLEVSEYFSSVKRLDDTVGRILQALDEQGVSDNTIVIFLSDHGMAVPFSKTNCYLQSTNSPLLVRWPGVTKAGTLDNKHFVSGIDFYPTVLDALGIEIPEGLDGRSYVELLKGETQADRNSVFTEFHETSSRNCYPMRCVQDEQYGYIFNAWANGVKEFKNESQHGRTWKAMKEAAPEDKDIADRVELFSHRVVEEFYDFKNDPNALNNLINDPKYKVQIEQKQEELIDYMKSSNDQLLEAFTKRNDQEFLTQYVAKLQAKAKARKRNH